MPQQNQQTGYEIRSQQKRFWLVILTTLFTALFIAACTQASSDGAADCTDICVDSQFETFYRENELASLFGEPYSSVVLVQPYTPFSEESGGNADIKAQYFNGGRLELNPETGMVEIAMLGHWAYEGLGVPNVVEGLPDGEMRCFENTICIQGAFLDFYSQKNGETLFGLPISPQLNEGDLRVQYFENVRLEWHPEAPVGQQVQVGLIGRAHYLYTVYDPRIIVARPLDDIELDAVEVTAAVRAPIMYADDEQVIYVLVETTDRKNTVEGMEIGLDVTHNGETYSQEISEKTSGTGTIQVVVDLPNFTPGEEVQIEIFAYSQDGNVIGSTLLTFQTWW